MAQPTTSPKIEELRFKLKLDAKSRLFYPLAEELRKAGELGEAESVLRAGITNHPTYLSAWVSLGRVLREESKNLEAVEALTRALQLDPGNPVAARLLADVYLALGEKIEAVKKYKLVHALLPADEELEATIARLDAEIGSDGASHERAAAPSPAPAPVESQGMPPGYQATLETPFTVESAIPDTAPMGDSPWTSPPPTDIFEESPVASHRDTFDETTPSMQRPASRQATGDSEPMRLAHTASPFEEPAAEIGYSSDAFAVESPEGMHIARAPLSADVPATPEDWKLPAESAQPIPPEPLPEAAAPAEAADVFAPAEDSSETPFEPEAPPIADEVANTITMADLYARQGLVADARRIYEEILARDPSNGAVRQKLNDLEVRGREPALSEPVTANAPNPKIKRLESWLTKVGRRELSRV